MHVIFDESTSLLKNSEDFIDEQIKVEVASKQDDIENHPKLIKEDASHQKNTKSTKIDLRVSYPKRCMF